MEQTNCNLCGSAQATLLYTLPDYLLGRKEIQTTLVRCSSCGLIYQNPRPTLEEMDQHYPPEYESFTSLPDPKKVSWLMRQALHYGLVKRGRFVTRHKHAGRLLDVGCATGFFLNGMRTQGDWELHGVEVNPYAAQIARDQYGLKVFTGTLEKAAYPDGFFDAVTLWDVLEHLHDPSAALREIRRILKPDGILVFRVPNASSRDARRFGQFWAGLDAPRHLYVFTPDTLAKLLPTAGFQILDRSAGSGNYTTFLLSLRFWLAGQEPRPSYADSLVKILYHPVMRLISAPFFYLRGLGLGGPQIVVTARKAPRDQNHD